VISRGSRSFGRITTGRLAIQAVAAGHRAEPGEAGPRRPGERRPVDRHQAEGGPVAEQPLEGSACRPAPPRPGRPRRRAPPDGAPCRGPASAAPPSRRRALPGGTGPRTRPAPRGGTASVSVSWTLEGSSFTPRAGRAGEQHRGGVAARPERDLRGRLGPAPRRADHRPGRSGRQAAGRQLAPGGLR